MEVLKYETKEQREIGRQPRMNPQDIQSLVRFLEVCCDCEEEECAGCAYAPAAILYENAHPMDKMTISKLMQDRADWQKAIDKSYEHIAKYEKESNTEMFWWILISIILAIISFIFL